MLILPVLSIFLTAQTFASRITQPTVPTKSASAALPTACKEIEQFLSKHSKDPLYAFIFIGEKALHSDDRRIWTDPATCNQSYDAIIKELAKKTQGKNNLYFGLSLPPLASLTTGPLEGRNHIMSLAHLALDIYLKELQQANLQIFDNLQIDTLIMAIRALTYSNERIMEYFQRKFPPHFATRVGVQRSTFISKSEKLKDSLKNRSIAPKQAIESIHKLVQCVIVYSAISRYVGINLDQAKCGIDHETVQMRINDLPDKSSEGIRNSLLMTVEKYRSKAQRLKVDYDLLLESYDVLTDDSDLDKLQSHYLKILKARRDWKWYQAFIRGSEEYLSKLPVMVESDVGPKPSITQPQAHVAAPSNKDASAIPSANDQPLAPLSDQLERLKVALQQTKVLTDRMTKLGEKSPPSTQ